MSSDVVRAIEISEFLHSPTAIGNSKVQEWKESLDENVLGLLLYAVSSQWSRIQPGLSRAEYGDLVLSVFRAAVEGRSLKKTSYAQSPYEIGHTFASWASDAVSNASLEPQVSEVLARTKEVLAALYRGGDESQRRCVVDGVLEHLFENKEIRQLFASWQLQSDLLPAFEEAAKWSERILRKRALLHSVAEGTAQRLLSKGIKIRSRDKMEVGTDTVVLEFDEQTEARSELVIDCDDELLGVLERLNPDATANFLESLSDYAADSTHWSPGEHIASQLWVNIPASAY
jgi:hypothetical protein